jgi:hypothetical protein
MGAATPVGNRGSVDSSPMALFDGKLRVGHQAGLRLPRTRSLTMRRLTLTSAIAILTLSTGCAAGDTMAPMPPSLRVEEAGHNATEHQSGVDAIEFEILSPCNGELIAFTGTDTYSLTLVGTPEALASGFAVHGTFHSHVRATGTGLESGATYTMDDVFQESFNSPSPPATQFTFAEHGRLHITSDVAGLSFVGYFLFRGVVLPDGEFKVVVESERVECQG